MLKFVNFKILQSVPTIEKYVFDKKQKSWRIPMSDKPATSKVGNTTKVSFIRVIIIS